MPTMAFAGDDKKTLVRQRVIENLEKDESLVGADVATALALKEGDRLSLLGREFKVTALLPQTGTIDDSASSPTCTRCRNSRARGRSSARSKWSAAARKSPKVW